MDLYLLIDVFGRLRDPTVASLLGDFNRAVLEHGFEALVSHQMRYAIRLADSEGDLIYEEMHKLLSLCDGIHGLKALEMAVEPMLQREFEASVRRRFAVQDREARLAAQDKRTPWNRDRWWYAERVRRC